MRTLIFITSHFPYYPGESFIEAEFPYLYSAFDRVIIIARDVSSNKTRPLPPGVKVYRYNPSSSPFGYLSIPVILGGNLKKTVSVFKDEVSFRNEIKRPLSFFQKLFLMKTMVKSLQFRDFIQEVIKREKLEDGIVIYSYWMNIGARAMSLLDDFKGIRIARAHRIDLYEKVTDMKYLPLLRRISLTLDAIFFISEHGKEYFEYNTGLPAQKNLVSRLGINNPYPFNPGKAGSDVFRIVSCSGLIKVKRVHLIIQALDKLRPGKKIIWNHFGEGDLKDELYRMAEKRLGSKENFGFRFMGQVPNAELMEFYNSHGIGLFINTSASEGIPVSIMEAQSFGIPVIATDTGGIREIIKENTGIILPPLFSIADLTNWIEYYVNMEPEEMAGIKNIVYNNWKQNFSARSNYEEFIKKVNRILASGKNDTNLPS
jgi:glycosyltransferase involved in cell wall biosynthesis